MEAEIATSSLKIDNDRVSSNEEEAAASSFQAAQLKKTNELENFDTSEGRIGQEANSKERENTNNRKECNMSASITDQNHGSFEVGEVTSLDANVTTLNVGFSRHNRRTRNYRSRAVSQSSSSSSTAEESRPSSLTCRNSAANPTGLEINAGSYAENGGTRAPENISTSDLDASYDQNTSADNDSSDDERNETANTNDSESLNEVLNKSKPSYCWSTTYELMCREHGLSNSGRSYFHTNSILGNFRTRFYSSRHVVEKLALLHCLKSHSGCVNSLNFNRSGNLICSGSDDTRIIVWDWALNKFKVNFRSGHTENIFQTQFIESTNYFDIVSSSRDGQVRRSIIPPSGGKPDTSTLYKHNGAVHKLAINPQNHFEILSAGVDGNIQLFDIRNNSVNKLKIVKAKKKKVRLFSIAHHPFDPEICVCGSDNFVRVYDKRYIANAVHQMCPQALIDTKTPHVTCSVYNSTGSEIVSSYSGDDIYLFNNKVYIYGHYSHRYRGHYNHKTIKGVNFFGLNSEYVISGSDCGHIFIWEKNTEAIINFMDGDSSGIVNCLEPHPFIPVLATSGLDYNIKVWSPTSERYPPDISLLEPIVKRNLKRSVVEDFNAIGDRQFRTFIRQLVRSSRRLNSSDGSSLDLPSSSEDDDMTSTVAQNHLPGR